jgi:hypothetical protein
MKSMVSSRANGSRLATRLRSAFTLPVIRGGGGSDRGDLCSTCMYRSECAYRSTPGRPKLHCEMFDVDVQALTRHETLDAPSPEATDTVEAMRGLCCNCANRAHCTIRMPEGDVWHCEEYY